jgi:nitrite reductase (NO-forming)
MIDRSFDRRIVVLGILLAVGLLVLAVASLALPTPVRRGGWLPLHLAMAGGASTAIAALMPFFVAAFAAAPPADPRLRSAAVGLVATGAMCIAAGVVAGIGGLGPGGGAMYVVGIAATAAAAIRPVSRSLGPSRGLVTRAYLVALGHVAIGGVLASLLLAGWPPVVDAWGRIRPAHAWLNVVGFVSLVIATTLLHFFPTVIGSRIAARRTATLTVIALVLGPELAAVGFVAGLDSVARAGAALSLAGPLALALYASAAWRARGRWTTDLAWHRFAMGGLISAMAWFGLGVAIAAIRVLDRGGGPDAWDTSVVAGPLVVGWAGMAILASATHLLPAVGPGSPAAHATQRRLLGRWSVARLVTLDLGCLALTGGLNLSLEWAVTVGAVLLGMGTAATVALLGASVAIGMTSRGQA